MKEIQNITKIEYKNFGFKIKDEFLTNSNSLSSDVNYFIQVPHNVNSKLNEFYTILINLTESKDLLWSNIYSRTQTEINSFITNQKFEHKILSKISKIDLNNFMNNFDNFAKEKNIRTAERKRIKAYNNSGVLAISYIKQNGLYLFVNFYRVTKERATNLHSFQDIKSTKKFNQSHFGRAHRTLHWLDILEFKNLGVNYYDFCGWYEGKTDEKLLHINKFKEQFSKNIIKEYSGVIYANKLLRLIKKIKSFG